MLTKSTGRTEIPTNEMLVDRTYTALKRVASDTIPLRLVVEDSAGHQILRRVDDNTYVRFPKRPIIDSGQTMDIDDELLDAVALYIMAGLELQRSKTLMGLYYKEIETYDEKLTETYLGIATNDSRKFYVFP